MVDHTKLQAALTELVAVMVRRGEVGRVLEQLPGHCVAVLGCDGAGVTLPHGGKLRLAGATDAAVTRLEQRQIALGQGPCQDAVTTGAVTASPDLADEERWPGWRREALDEGVRAVVAIPLVVETTTVIGGVSLSWLAAHTPTDEELRAGRLLAEMAAALITNLRVLSDAQRLSEQLQEVLDRRLVIQEATGIIEERHDLDSRAALERLHAYARPRNRRISAIAQEIVGGELDV